MASASLDALLQQLGVTPPSAAQRYAPIFNQSPMVPPATSEAMGLPFPSSYMGAEMAGSAPAEEAPVEDAAPMGAQMLGYNPQPRPDLAAAITQGPLSDLFRRYRDVYSPPQPAANPLAALLPATPPAQPAGYPDSGAVPGVMLAPQQATMPRLTREDRRQQMLNRPPSEAERLLMDRSPEYARPIQRSRQLDAMRLQRGY
jgi:hypothetical protein